MPNIKSAKKRVKVTNAKHIANKRIDKAVGQGLITKNKAARLKSNISKKVNESK